MSDTVTVSKVTLLHRVAVIELASAEGGQFLDALDTARTRARIIVVDCLNQPVLPHAFLDSLAAIQSDLARQGGHLIVVNAPDEAITDLRFIGIDAATTTDLRFEPPGHPTLNRNSC